MNDQITASKREPKEVQQICAGTDSTQEVTLVVKSAFSPANCQLPYKRTADRATEKISHPPTTTTTTTTTTMARAVFYFFRFLSKSTPPLIKQQPWQEQSSISSGSRASQHHHSSNLDQYDHIT
jgi:hypothetical protein